MGPHTPAEDGQACYRVFFYLFNISSNVSQSSICISRIRSMWEFPDHTGQCKRTGGCYNELVVAFFSTSSGVKGKKIYTC